MSESKKNEMTESEKKNEIFEPDDERLPDAASIDARITAGGRFECEVQADSIQELESLVEFINTISFR